MSASFGGWDAVSAAVQIDAAAAYRGSKGILLDSGSHTIRALMRLPATGDQPPALGFWYRKLNDAQSAELRVYPSDTVDALVDAPSFDHHTACLPLAWSDQPMPFVVAFDLAGGSGEFHVDEVQPMVAKIVGLYDKGKGAVVVSEAESVDAATGELLFRTRSSAFIRGEGGFGGDRGPSGPSYELPARKADHEITYQTRPDQALLYRLSGDRNPLHSDPEFAKLAGFPRPILHGLCTYGFTGRALLHALCGGDPARFKSMEGRFSKPVFPGEALTIKMWVDGTRCLFQTLNEAGEVVLDQGRMSFV